MFAAGHIPRDWYFNSLPTILPLNTLIELLQFLVPYCLSFLIAFAILRRLFG